MCMHMHTSVYRNVQYTCIYGSCHLCRSLIAAVDALHGHLVSLQFGLLQDSKAGVSETLSPKPCQGRGSARAQTQRSNALTWKVATAPANVSMGPPSKPQYLPALQK